MLTHHYPTNFKQQLPNDHDLTELSWLTRSDMFDQRSSNSVRQLPKLSQSLPAYVTDKEDIPRHHHSSPSSLIDSSDSEHDNDSSSLNSSSERVTTVNLTDIVSPPHSALCFWILFAIEESKTRSLTLNEICDWIERHIEQQQQLKTTNPTSSDEQLIRSARLKNPVSGIKLRYPLWATDRSKRQLLLDTLLTMNTRQLSLYTQYTIDIYERLCSERRLTLTRNTNDENSCPTLSKHNTKQIHSQME
ncbi:unnamed protein product [Rotaria sp. Silwood2]|nr:unnamed protein product [Rotaria sp. Silwood2]